MKTFLIIIYAIAGIAEVINFKSIYKSEANAFSMLLCFLFTPAIKTAAIIFKNIIPFAIIILILYLIF